MSIRLFIIILLMAASQAATGQSRDVRLATSTSTGALTLLADSVDYRSDLTRIYGRLSGVPHTAGRIDALTLRAGSGEAMKSTDLDGVDPERWFQWEDDGVIAVEIDFPPVKTKASALTVDCVTPRGPARWFITVKPAKKRARK